MSRVFANGLGDQGSIPGGVIPKIRWYFIALLSTNYYKNSIKCKVEQSTVWSSTHP